MTCTHARTFLFLVVPNSGELRNSCVATSSYLHTRPLDVVSLNLSYPKPCQHGRMTILMIFSCIYTLAVAWIFTSITTTQMKAWKRWRVFLHVTQICHVPCALQSKYYYPATMDFKTAMVAGRKHQASITSSSPRQREAINLLYIFTKCSPECRDPTKVLWLSSPF